MAYIEKRREVDFRREEDQFGSTTFRLDKTTIKDLKQAKRVSSQTPLRSQRFWCGYGPEDKRKTLGIQDFSSGQKGRGVRGVSLPVASPSEEAVKRIIR